MSATIAVSPPEIAPNPVRERSRRITTTDVLKFVGVAMFLIDHYGLCFDSDQNWWRVFGRLAPPIFFFLIGFARTRSVPWTWLAFGIVLTALEVWTSRDEGLQEATTFNILLNFALLRVAVLPLVERFVLGRPAALAVFAVGCVLLLDPTDSWLEYGTGGWLWAVLGLSIRVAGEGPRPGQRSICVAMALASACIYVVRETGEHGFSDVQALALAGMVAGLTANLLAFRRTDLPVQPPAPLALLIRFCGRHSLGIFAVTLFSMQLLGHVAGLDGGSDGDEADD